MVCGSVEFYLYVDGWMQYSIQFYYFTIYIGAIGWSVGKFTVNVKWCVGKCFLRSVHWYFVVHRYMSFSV
jgi:hypothetical protein